jgi:hypothetical protein
MQFRDQTSSPYLCLFNNFTASPSNILRGISALISIASKAASSRYASMGSSVTSAFSKCSIYLSSLICWSHSLTDPGTGNSSFAMGDEIRGLVGAIPAYFIRKKQYKSVAW